ncbi:MAG: hypothetical protein WCL11_18610 [Verrucomicrobiota bacterium]
MNAYAIRLAIASILAAASFTASAAVMYESMPYARWQTEMGQGPLTTMSLSSRFTLANSTALSGTLLGLLTSGGAPTSVDWKITSASFSGTTLASGTAALTSTLAKNYGLSWFDSSFSFSSPVNLSAGTYWLELDGGTAESGSPIYWVIGGVAGSDTMQKDSGGIHDLGASTTAFQLLGTLSPVPEPSEWVAISFGLLGIVWVVKRRFAPACS